MISVAKHNTRGIFRSHDRREFPRIIPYCTAPQYAALPHTISTAHFPAVQTHHTLAHSPTPHCITLLRIISYRIGSHRIAPHFLGLRRTPLHRTSPPSSERPPGRWARGGWPYETQATSPQPSKPARHQCRCSPALLSSSPDVPFSVPLTQRFHVSHRFAFYIIFAFQKITWDGGEERGRDERGGERRWGG